MIAHVKAVLDDLVRREGPRNHFTVGIVDDVTHTSLPVDEDFDIESDDRVRAVFFGLGADGTVGANKNSIKIIGEETDNYGQGYFVYDSKKAGAVTISHLRFGPDPIRSSYLIRKAKFVACHQWVFTEKLDMLSYAEPGATFLVNSPFGPDEIWDQFPKEVQEDIKAKDLKVYCIDATKVAADTGMGRCPVSASGSAYCDCRASGARVSSRAMTGVRLVRPIVKRHCATRQVDRRDFSG